MNDRILKRLILETIQDVMGEESSDEEEYPMDPMEVKFSFTSAEVNDQYDKDEAKYLLMHSIRKKEIQIKINVDTIKEFPELNTRRFVEENEELKEKIVQELDALKNLYTGSRLTEGDFLQERKKRLRRK